MANFTTTGSDTFASGHILQMKTYNHFPGNPGNSTTTNGLIASSTPASLITLSSTSNPVHIAVSYNIYTDSGCLGGKTYIMEYDTSGSASGTAPVVTGSAANIADRASNVAPHSAHHYITGPSHNYWTTMRQGVDPSPASVTRRYALAMITMGPNGNAVTIAGSATFGLKVEWVLTEIQA